MKNVEELRTHLSAVFTDLKAGGITHKDASEMANLAGKMINSAKVQVEYYSIRKETPVIAFLESTAQDSDTMMKAREA
jgi:5-formyltetrahydrofolate cyclo-ligase